jgi:hypothetical protein
MTSCPNCDRTWYGFRDAACRPLCADCGHPVPEPQSSQDGPTGLFAERWPGIPQEAHPLLTIDRDAAIEAGVVAARVERLPEHDDTIAEMVALGISVALDHLAALPYPVQLGPARPAETVNGA